MKPYNELTRRGRLRRLRELAQAALQAYGLSGAPLTFLQYEGNVIFRVDAPRPVAGLVEQGPYVENRYVLRVLTTSDVEAVASELTWLAALSQEGGLPAPVPTLDGELLITITTPGVPQGRIVSLMRWVDGRRLTNGFRPGHLGLGAHDGAPARVFSGLAASRGPDVYGMIHADMYPENVLFKAGEVFPIDFEDCGYGYWMWDIAVVLCTWPWTQEWYWMRDAFLEGYATVRTLPESQLKHLDLFMATQYATMVLWATALIKNDPARQAEHSAWRDRDGTKLLRYFELH